MWTITISVWLTKGQDAVTFESAAMMDRIEATDLFNALKRQLGPMLNKIQMLRDGVEFLCAYGHPIKVRVVKD